MQVYQNGGGSDGVCFCSSNEKVTFLKLHRDEHVHFFTHDKCILYLFFGGKLYLISSFPYTRDKQCIIYSFFTCVNFYQHSEPMILGY